MVEQPDWSEAVSPEELLNLIDGAFQRKYSRPMTKDARRELRRVLNEELASLENDTSYENGIESPQHAANGFTELAAGDLKLKGNAGIDPPPARRTLDRYQKVGLVAIRETVKKARQYHRANGGTCPVWPF